MTLSAYLPQTTRLYSMEGRDARDFLHRLTTTNTRDLETGSFKRGFFLNPQGKARATFRVACVGADAFLLEVEGGRDGHWAKEFLAVLEQFTFAEDYRIEERVGLKNAWVFGLPDAKENSVETRGELTLLHGSVETFGENWTSIWGPTEEVDAFLGSLPAQALSEEDFEHRRVLALFPGADRELVPDANPLELGLRSAIDDGKGCYPGQEVIEKIISLGSPAKRLARVESDSPITIGAKFFLEDGKTEVGSATSASTRDGRSIALALLRKNALEEGKNLKLENGSSARVGKIARYE
jgi:folate-binding protein YgfZ